MLTEDDVIVAVGRDLGVSEAEVIDAGGRIVFSVVDAHRHTWQTQLRGCCSDMSLNEYRFGFWSHAVGAYTADGATSLSLTNGSWLGVLGGRPRPTRRAGRVAVPHVGP